MIKHFVVFSLFACLSVQELPADQTYQRKQDGFEVLGLRNDYWSVEVVPDLGGKLISLADQVSGREWLWSREEDRHLLEAEQFGHGNLIGADELFPNLIAEEWDDRQLPGHGELWSSKTKWDCAALQQGVIRTEVSLESMPIDYKRELSLDGREITIEITVTNTSGKALPFLWAWHPLFNIEAGDEFLISSPPAEFRVMGAPGLPDLGAGDTLSWPGEAQGVDLSTLSLGDVPKAGIKLYSDAPGDSQVTLNNTQTGAGLTLVSDTDSLPYMAIWLSRGVWGNAHHLAIEPTNLSGESLETAVPASYLGPNEQRAWRLKLVNISED
ncbi:DUF5107 domain-containing protein [Cerasicoccus frondis]|uniref:aldose epimerase family protein n=1 Tax=Cerasicoccus frondis TaxID=490090 RepID=UPI0028525729|nr:DUF5107 domain-containing protein [Cerasicoccus frondis]